MLNATIRQGDYKHQHDFLCIVKSAIQMNMNLKILPAAGNPVFVKAVVVQTPPPIPV